MYWPGSLHVRQVQVLLSVQPSIDTSLCHVVNVNSIRFLVLHHEDLYVEKDMRVMQDADVAQYLYLHPLQFRQLTALPPELALENPVALLQLKCARCGLAPKSTGPCAGFEVQLQLLSFLFSTNTTVLEAASDARHWTLALVLELPCVYSA